MTLAVPRRQHTTVRCRLGVSPQLLDSTIRELHPSVNESAFTVTDLLDLASRNASRLPHNCL